MHTVNLSVRQRAVRGADALRRRHPLAVAGAVAVAMAVSACGGGSTSSNTSSSSSPGVSADPAPAPATSPATSPGTEPAATEPVATDPVITDPVTSSVDTVSDAFDAACLDGHWIGDAEKIQFFADQLVPGPGGLMFTIGRDSVWDVTITGDQLVANNRVTAIYTTPEGANITASGTGQVTALLLVTADGRIEGYTDTVTADVWEMSMEIDGVVTPLPINPATFEGGFTRFELLDNTVTCTDDTLTFINTTNDVPPITLERAG